jgi:N-acetylmuramoyl-L-alanine amidase
MRKLEAVICCALLIVFGGLCIYGKKTGEAIMTAATVKASPERPTLVIDAGHGGADGGCVSVNGAVEKDINLSILLTLRDTMTVMGYDVTCTREADKSIHDKGVEGLKKQKLSDMKNRLAIFGKYKDGISVSIHQNQFTDPQYSGAQMFYSEKNADGEVLAKIMQKQFKALLQPDNEREAKAVGDDLYLLDNTTNPAIMIECGFLSNPDEAAKLESAPYQKQVAFTIMTGIKEYELSKK